MLITISFVEQTCCVKGCGVEFAVTAAFDKQRIEKKDTFYCPNGHAQHYCGQTEADKFRAEKLRLEASVEWERSRVRRLEEKNAAERLATRAQKGRATRFKNERDTIRKRIANGVCPCCNRHFTNVMRHIAGQHPNFVLPDPSGDVE